MTDKNKNEGSQQDRKDAANDILEHALRQEKLVNALEQGIAARDERIEQLESGLDKHMALYRDLRKQLRDAQQEVGEARSRLAGNDNSSKLPAPTRADQVFMDAGDMLDPNVLLADDELDDDSVVLPTATELPVLIEPSGDSTATHDDRVGRLLIMMDGDDEIRYPLYKDEITIGRSNDADIQIHSRFSSRMHAIIRTRGSTAVIEDAGSKNGILVNSEYCGRHTLNDGDLVNIGELQLQFVELDKPPTA